MGVKEFINDIKEMVKTKDMTKVNEKYVHPAWEMSKEMSAKAKEFVVENTPKVIAASKAAMEKTKEMVDQFSKKGEKNKVNQPDQRVGSGQEPKQPDTSSVNKDPNIDKDKDKFPHK